MARRPTDAPKSTKNLVVTKDRVGEMLTSIEDLTLRELLVGVPAATAPREPEAGEAPIDNATIGYIMEFGAPSVNIPERPFLIPGVQAAKDRVAKRMERAAVAALDGKEEAVDAEFDAAGLIAQTAVQRKITDGPFVPLAPATIARRRSRKPPRMGTKPLLDTGKLRQSISYVVRTRKRDD